MAQLFVDIVTERSKIGKEGIKIIEKKERKLKPLVVTKQ
jgi:hypothetical protein